MARFHPFLWSNNISLCIYTPQFHYPFIYQWLSPCLTIVNNAAATMGMHISFRVSIYIFFGISLQLSSSLRHQVSVLSFGTKWLDLSSVKRRVEIAVDRLPLLWMGLPVHLPASVRCELCLLCSWHCL